MSALLTFGSKAGGEVIMLRAHVEPMFKAMGRPLHDQGAILGEDLPSVIAAMQALLEGTAPVEVPSQEMFDESEDDAEEQKVQVVSLRTRFYPLLALMNKAKDANEALHWRPL